MELKKVIMLEILAMIIGLVVVMTFVGLMPYLASSQQNRSIGVYSEKVFDEGNVTLIRGKTVQSAIFNYTTFDPAILVLDLNFQTWQSRGNLTISVNGQIFATISPSPDNPQVTLKAVSFSGTDLVKPYEVYSRFFSNGINFSSKPNEGYSGTFSYRISIRGSR